MLLLIAIVLLIVYAGLVFYIGWSGWSWIRGKASLPVKLLYVLTLSIVSTAFLFGMFFKNVVFDIIGAYWMALFYLLLIVLPVAHLTVWLLGKTALPGQPVRIGVGIASLSVVIGLLAYGTHQAYSPVVRSYEIAVDKQAPARYAELHIVVASDMHFGILSRAPFAAKLVREINALKPDLVLFPGDLLDDEKDQFLKQGMDRILKELEAPLGVYASLGNHDRHEGPIQELIDALEASGMKVLYDEKLVVGDFLTLIGRRDRNDRTRESLTTLMKESDPAKPVILMDHQPYELEAAERHGVDLVVSGHTHRGQVAPAFLLTKRLFTNDWGYAAFGSTHTVVSSGYGFWGPPIRIGTRSEIVSIKVSFAS